MSKTNASKRRELKALLKSSPSAALPPAARPVPALSPAEVGDQVEQLLQDLPPLTSASQRAFEHSLAALDARPSCPPSHRLTTRQWVLLELVKTAMHTSDEGYSSTQDALVNLPSLRQLVDEIVGDDR